MNRGIALKAAREALGVTIAFAIAAMVFEGLLAAILPVVPEQITEQWLQIGFVQKIFQGLLGTKVGNLTTSTALTAIAWVHPMVLTIFWAHAITQCTQIPAGEIDHGTIDLLGSLPVSRLGLFTSTFLVWLLDGVVLVIAAMAGHLIGQQFAPHADRSGWAELAPVLVNLYVLYAAVCGLAALSSVASDRRGRAVAAVFGVLIGMYVLNFLAQLWEPARSVSFLSVLYYYRPLDVLREGVWPARDLIVLGAAGVVTWVVAAVVFSRRDIRTV